MVSEDEIEITKNNGKNLEEYLDYLKEFRELLAKPDKLVLRYGYGTKNSGFESGGSYSLFLEVGSKSKGLVEISKAGHSFKEKEIFLYQLSDTISEFLFDEAEDS